MYSTAKKKIIWYIFFLSASVQRFSVFRMRFSFFLVKKHILGTFLECPKVVCAIFYEWLRYLLPFGLGRTMKAAEERSYLINLEITTE